MLTPIGEAIDAVVRPVEWPDGVPADGTPYVTHRGHLDFGRVSVEVVVLSDGRRLVTQAGVDALLASFAGEIDAAVRVAGGGS